MSFFTDVNLFHILAYTAVFTVVYAVWAYFRQRHPSKLDPSQPVRECGSCEHFDHDEGQAVLRRFPTFLEATRMVSLNRQTTTYDDNGNIAKSGAVPERAELSQFGACLKHSELRWCEDPGCDLYQLRIRRTRVSS